MFKSLRFTQNLTFTVKSFVLAILLNIPLVKLAFSEELEGPEPELRELATKQPNNRTITTKSRVSEEV